ncbi:MAG TPA: trypsin-like peptidase domain-containing protein [Kofleriaceae bacterium]|nr:trypsin-like peptidase domain-containing protein [Kofleriaceae bacterium]
MVVSRHVHALLIGAALIASTAARADDVSPEQKIALMAKPAVVRVMGAYVAKYSIGGSSVMTVAIGGSGTGWFITPDGYIATNAHVVEDIKDGESAAKDALAKEFLRELEQQSRGALSRMSAAERQQLLGMVQLVDLKKMVYVVLQNGDQLDYDVKQFGKPGTGKDCAILKVKTQNAPTLPIGDSNLTQVEDRVVVIGYPGVADQKELLDHNSQLQPSITDGAISALKKSSEGDPILQTSVPITHGNSGGPAIDQHGNVIGLATFGTDVQGFNFLVASVTLQDFIKNASVEPKQGDTDKAWRDGLEHFWAEEYTDAIKDFEEVETLYPQHAEAPRLITLSHQAQKDGKEKKSGAGVGAIVGAIVGIVALVGVIAFVLTRKKQPAQMRPPMPGQPMPGQPMQQMYGRAPAAAQGGPAQVPKTVAIQQQPGGSGGYAPTAFVSQAIGSLQCTRGRLMGQRFALTATGIIVGRQPGVAHVLIDDQRASGKHVWIGMENGRLVAIDQGTTNGTYVNDIARGRISRAELRDGDIVIVSEPDCLSLQVRLG